MKHHSLLRNERNSTDMRHKNSKEENFDKFYEAVSPMLNKLGKIRTKDIWEAYKFQFSYTYLCPNFKTIMDTMVEQGKAIKISGGHWNIIKPNQKTWPHPEKEKDPDSDGRFR